MNVRTLILLFAASLPFNVRSTIEIRVANYAPAERLATNLTQELAVRPRDGELYAQLARVYSIWAAREAYGREVLVYDKAKNIWAREQLILREFRRESGYQSTTNPPVPLKPEAKLAYHRHLAASIKCYETAIQLGKTNAFVYLGLGWTQQQAGKTNAARDNFRIALKLSRAYEPTLEWMEDLDITSEAAEYLMALLDPVGDKAERADAQEAIVSAIHRRQFLKVTPILVPLKADHTPLRDLVDWNAQVEFNLDGSGPNSWQWITTNAAWIVYQRKPDEPITSGIQLFGNFTFWIFWRNGYDALAALDDDGNAYIEGSELDHLSLWHDRNSNGISEPGELAPLSSYGIIRLSTRSRLIGDSTWISNDGALFRDGNLRPTYDIGLQKQHE